MSNIITKHEMLEQYGDVQLRLDLYANRYFIFHGQSRDKKDILLMVHIDTVRELNPHSFITVNFFKDVFLDEDNKNNYFIKVKITDGFSNIYQSMDSGL